MKVRATRNQFLALLFWALALMPTALYAQVITNILMIPQPRLIIVSALGISNRVEYSSELASNDWLTLTNVLVSQSPYQIVDQGALPATKRFYRALDPVAPFNSAPISAGSFLMGDLIDGYGGGGYGGNAPTQTINVAAFYMDRFLVTKALWDDVYQWAIVHGYGFEFGAAGKATNHPAQNMTWYDAVKWCNARSEREGRVPAYYTSSGQTNVFRTGQNKCQQYLGQMERRLPVAHRNGVGESGAGRGRSSPFCLVTFGQHHA